MGDKILDDAIKVWNVGNIQIGRIWAANTAKAMSQTVTGVTVGATYDLTLTASAVHGYTTGSHLRLTGAAVAAYNGAYTVISSPTTSTMEVYGTYSADDTGLSAVLVPALAPGVPFRILETRLFCSGTCATENFTMTLDSGFDSTLDVVLFSQPMASVTSVVENWSDTLKLFTADDAVVFGFANGNGINWGLEVIYQFLGA